MLDPNHFTVLAGSAVVELLRAEKERRCVTYGEQLTTVQESIARRGYRGPAQVCRRARGTRSRQARRGARIGSTGGAGRRHFYAGDQRVVDDRCEDDYDLTAAVGGCREALSDGLELSACRREDVEVGQHLRTVDRDIKGARSGGRRGILAEVQPHRIRATVRKC